MKYLLSGLLLFAFGQGSQSVRHDEPTRVAGDSWLPSQQAAIDSTLTALKQQGASQTLLSQQLAHAMIIGLTDKDRRPPWPLVANFADNLTRELLGKQLTNAQNTVLRECLSKAVRPTGAGNARLASRLQETLVAVGLKPSKTQIIVSDFIKLRESVQGPDDVPVKDVKE